MKKLNTVLVPSWGFLYINAHKKSIGGKCYEFSSPHGDFFILTIYIECFAKTFKTFSSPHGDFFILTRKYNRLRKGDNSMFSSPHGDFFILTILRK